MDLDRSTSRSPCPSRQDKILNAVVDYGYCAGHLVAREEERERILRDCALSRELAAGESTAAPRPRVDLDGVRLRLGELLLRTGARLQGPPAAAPGVPGQVSSAGWRP